MKLFVSGSSSPHPEDWSEWDEIIIVVAENEKQVKQLTSEFREVSEIPMDRAQVIYSAPSPELWTVVWDDA